MPGRTIAIIGAGVAGLATGVYARANGYDAHIFEHNSTAGGVCTAWDRGEYTFDCCLHWLMGAKPGSRMHGLYQEVGALDGTRVIPLDTYGAAVDEGTGRSIVVTRDLDRLSADLRALSARDSRFVDRLMHDVGRFRKIEMPVPDSTPAHNAIAVLADLWRMRQTLAFMARRGNKSVAEVATAISDRFLHLVISNLFVPEMPYVFLLMLLAGLANDELATVEGGSRAFAGGIERRYRALGGKITFNATVNEIIVEGNRAVGVKLADGTTHRADIVVSAADGRSTIFDMLHGRYLDAAVRERYNMWPIFAPLVLANYGCRRRWSEEAGGTAVFLEDPIEIAGRPVGQFFYRTFPHNPEFAPKGASVVQVLAQTEWHPWAALVKDRPAYDAEKERIASALLRRLEPYLPGITTAVEETDVATPHTFWRYSRNYRGAFEGFLMTPKMLTTRVAKTLPGLSNFYMAGQWVEPGGGLPPAVASGRGVVRLICRHDGREFRAPE